MRSQALEGEESLCWFSTFLKTKHMKLISPAKKMHTGAGTKQKIRERMVGHKTPSPIYDELFDEGGGMDFKSSSDLP